MTFSADVLVVMPHPDDSEFGVAGTVAHWIKEGKQVVYLICTNGNKGTSDRSLSPKQLSEIREREQRAAAEMLGVRETVFLGYPDQGLEDTPSFRKEIVRIIRRFRPRIVVTSDPYRRYIWHRDHRITGLVTLDAVFPYARDHLAYPELLEEGLEPHNVEEIWFWASEDINLRSDITATFDLKLAALKCHASQLENFHLHDLDQWLRKRAVEMAEGEEFELAEGFHRVVIAW
jgi:LmbE family N-acetylglucosaminyl deacetylase